MSEPTWPLQWVRASLDLAILGCLIDTPLHGYGIARQLEQRGFGRLKGGSLYPALGHLEDAGYIMASWEQGEVGPGRKNYAITGAGHDFFISGLTKWKALTQALDISKES